jgi:uncharacterized protein YjiS (DUF1127 family)
MGVQPSPQPTDWNGITGMKNIARKYKAWRSERQRRRQLIRELDSMTDRDLLDLGFSRYDFAAIINGTYQR